jgi:hypothetical protein
MNLRVSIILPALATLTLSGCPAEILRPMDQRFPHETLSLVTADTALLDRQPIDSSTVVHRTVYLGAPGRVLHAGTVVRRSATDDSEAIASAEPKLEPGSSPWIHVEVSASAELKHVGWRGWVHTRALEPVVGSAGAPPPPADLVPDRLSGAARLCANPGASDYCPLEVHPSLPLRVAECQPSHAKVELWDLEGIYVVGFLARTEFEHDPCGNQQ